MKQVITDPTAGQRARDLREHPSAPQRITDPTDPRYGELTRGAQAWAAAGRRIVDPTDPKSGGHAA